MSDRLRELLRQRALLHEHLAWLEKEITAASEKKPENAAPPVEKLGVAPPPSPAKALSSSAGVAIVAKVIGATSTAGSSHDGPGAEAILEGYRVPPKTLQSDVRRGCFLYFIAAFVLLALGVTLLWFAIGTR